MEAIAKFSISGMTCGGCARHITRVVERVAGVHRVETSHEQGQCVVYFDDTVVTVEAISETINSTGYRVVSPV